MHLEYLFIHKFEKIRI